MKLLVFGDNHGDTHSFLHALEKAKDADVIVQLGDFTFFGQDIQALLALIATFPKQVILMHGNHEQEAIVRQLAQQHKNIRYSHKEIISVGEYDIITYGGGGFSIIDEEFEAFAEHIKKNIRNPNKTILILHAPPHDTALDNPFGNYHSGTVSFRKFIEEVQPLVVFAGHIHEGEGAFDYIEETLLHNPGPLGALINIEDLHHQRSQGKKLTVKKD
jgi:Icc-related predicted phosphoesterase